MASAPDFAKIQKTTPPAMKGEVAGLMSAYQSASAGLDSLPESPAPIDFAAYKSKISLSGFVEDIEKSYGAVKIEKAADTWSAGISSAKKAAESECAQLVKDAKARTAALEADLANFQAQKPIEETTVDEYLQANPAVAKQIDDDLKKFEYGAPGQA